MSTIWTPSGERPIRRDPEPTPSPTSSPTSPAGSQESSGGAGPGTSEQLSEEQLRAQLAEVQRQVAETPAEVVVANHAIGLFQLAVIHLDQPTPNFQSAQLAIDAMAGIVERLGARLGEEEAPLREALSQLQLVFVQRKSAGGQPPASD
jgi:hypothetical protein